MMDIAVDKYFTLVSSTEIIKISCSTASVN